MALTCPALIVLAGSAAVAQDGAKPLTIRQVMRDREALDGHVVTVRGELLNCVAGRCLLYENRRHAEAKSAYAISIAREAAFDQQASAHGNSRVTLRGKLDIKCLNRPPVKVTECGPRPASLSEIEVISWGS